MVEKIKNDPLLGDDVGEDASASSKPEGKKAKAGANSVAPAITSKKQQIKADAVAKFPKDIIAQTKYILDNSEHVNFIVPLLEGEIGIEEVTINGYKLTIKKNVMVSIPVQIANIIAEKYRINMEAGAEKRIDRKADVSEALS